MQCAGRWSEILGVRVRFYGWFLRADCFLGLNSAYGWPGSEQITPVLSQGSKNLPQLIFQSALQVGGCHAVAFLQSLPHLDEVGKAHLLGFP